MSENETENGSERAEMPSPVSADAKVKRVVKRKPLWLCVPKEYGEIVTDDGDIQRAPVSYELYECSMKAEVEEILAKLKIDIATLNPDHVKLFRAEPIHMRLSTQVTLKF